MQLRPRNPHGGYGGRRTLRPRRQKHSCRKRGTFSDLMPLFRYSNTELCVGRPTTPAKAPLPVMAGRFRPFKETLQYVPKRPQGCTGPWVAQEHAGRRADIIYSFTLPANLIPSPVRLERWPTVRRPSGLTEYAVS